LGHRECFSWFCRIITLRKYKTWSRSSACPVFVSPPWCFGEQEASPTSEPHVPSWAKEMPRAFNAAAFVSLHGNTMTTRISAMQSRTGARPPAPNSWCVAYSEGCMTPPCVLTLSPATSRT
jgi:hypothetical protein